MDPLSTLFRSLKVQQALVDRVEASAPWGFHADPRPDIRFIVVLRGSTTVRSEDRPKPLLLSSGDLYFRFGGHFSLSDQPSTEPVSCSALAFEQSEGTIRFGGGGAPTTLIAGRFNLDRNEAGPLLKVLPSSLHLRLDSGRSRAMNSILELVRSETELGGLASAEMVDRLCEMLLIHAVRAYSDQTGSDRTGWLAGITDGRLARTLQAVHTQLYRNWTVDSMAADAGMSRSAFAAHFKRVVGQGPREYLTYWRMHQASVLLSTTDLHVAKVARRVGYASESAFTKAFRRLRQTTPIKFAG